MMDDGNEREWMEGEMSESGWGGGSCWVVGYPPLPPFTSQPTIQRVIRPFAALAWRQTHVALLRPLVRFTNYSERDGFGGMHRL